MGKEGSEDNADRLDGSDAELDRIAEAEERRVDKELERSGSRAFRKPRTNSPQTPDINRPSNLTNDVRGKLNELQDICRIKYLRHFTLEPRAAIVRQVWGNSILKSDWEWGVSWSRIGNHNSNWKGRCIAYMKVLPFGSRD